MDQTKKQIQSSIQTLATNTARLSQLLTRKREELSPAYLKDAGLREAYVSYFLPPNMQKIKTPFRELSIHPAGLLSQATLRVLDIGSGPGTALLGVMEFFSRQDNTPQLELTAVDQVAENLREAEKLFSEHRTMTKSSALLKTIQSSIEDAAKFFHEQFDVIILSNILNELFSRDEEKIKKRTVLLNNLLGRLLTDSGSCIIIEPALRETSRDMLAMRDGLLAHGFHIYSPCFFSKSCPALANPKDWCHEDIPWEPPALIQEIDKLTGLRKDSLKFSYLVLRKDTLSLSNAYKGPVFRVISEPLVSKGKIEFYICGAKGRRLITRLDKDKTSRNHLFEQLHRGTVVCFERLIDEEKRYKVGKDTVVQSAVMEKCRS